MMHRPAEIRVGSAGLPAWRIVLGGLLCGVAAAGLLQYLLGTKALVQIWFLSLLLLLLASAGLLLEAIGALLGSGRLALDFFAPHIAFPLTFALLYTVGGLRQAYQWQPSQATAFFSYYFLGLLVFYGGGLLMTLLTRHGAPHRPLRCEWLPHRVVLATGVLFAASALVTLWIVAQAGLPVLRADVETARTLVLRQVGGYVYHFARTMAVPAVLAAVYLFTRFRSLSGLRRLLWLLVIACSLLALASSGYRNGAAAVLLTALVVFSYAVRRIKGQQVAVFVLAFSLLIGAYGFFRNQGTVTWEMAGIWQRVLHEIGLPHFTFTTIWNRFPSDLAFFRGRGMTLTFLALAPGQQPVLGPLLKELLGLQYAGGGFAPSILGSFYLEFGTPGIVVGMFLCGLVLALLYGWMRRRPNEYRVIVYSFVLVYCLEAIRDGMLKDIFPIWFLIVLFVVNVYCRRSPRLTLSWRRPGGGRG
jgi:oligosaccharide repeat unit polymerase